MLLKSSVDIKATPDDVFRFFSEMAEGYTRWHPDHLLFRWEGEQELREGAVFYFEERIAGKLFKKRVRFTHIVPGKLIEFAPTNTIFRLFLPRIAFAIDPSGSGIRVTQTLQIRTGPVGAWLNRREFATVQEHMDEEGANMKTIIEATKQQPPPRG